MEVKPSAGTYKPGGKATAELILTDLDGKPVPGQIVVSIYDKSVEAISGGSNVEDIRAAFWEWRRYHSSNIQDNLGATFLSMPEPDQPTMRSLGQRVSKHPVSREAGRHDSTVAFAGVRQS